LGDAVIHTGKEILALADKLDCERIIFATNVLDELAIPRFEGQTVYAVRISDNSFVGAAQTAVSGGKGPDTGRRLFDTTFYKN
jgi:hypothetical protein